MIWNDSIFHWSLLCTCFAYWLKWYFYLFSVAKLFRFYENRFSHLNFSFVFYSFECFAFSQYIRRMNLEFWNPNNLSHIICQMHYRSYFPFISASILPSIPIPLASSAANKVSRDQILHTNQNILLCWHRLIFVWIIIFLWIFFCFFFCLIRLPFVFQFA